MSTQTAPPQSPSDAPAPEAVQLAEQALEDALIAGADTGPARAALEAARAAAVAERDAADQAKRAAAEADHAAAQQAEAEAVEQAQDQVADAIEAIESAPDADPLPAPVESSIVRIAAEHLAQARAALAKADAPHAAAIAQRDAVRARLQPKTAELAAIRARRAAGNEQPEDAANMTALGMDIEDLEDMLVPLDAAVAAADPVAQQHAVDAAKVALDAAKKRAELEGMADRVRALEQHFVEQVRRLRLEAQKRGENNFASIFLPSEPLRRLSQGGWV